MKLAEAIRQAVQDENPVLASKLADYMRFRLGWNYGQTAAFVAKACAEMFDDRTARTRWEGLMYLADTQGC